MSPRQAQGGHGAHPHPCPRENRGHRVLGTAPLPAPRPGPPASSKNRDTNSIQQAQKQHHPDPGMRRHPGSPAGCEISAPGKGNDLQNSFSAGSLRGAGSSLVRHYTFPLCSPQFHTDYKYSPHKAGESTSSGLTLPCRGGRSTFSIHPWAMLITRDPCLLFAAGEISAGIWDRVVFFFLFKETATRNDDTLSNCLKGRKSRFFPTALPTLFSLSRTTVSRL